MLNYLISRSDRMTLPRSQLTSVRLVLLICLIYGFLSTSSPDKVGLPEVAIGVLLIYLVGLRSASTLVLLMDRRGSPPYIKLLAAFLLIAPTVVGLIFYQNEFGNYIRDIIPAIYIFLPVFLYDRVRKNPVVWVKTLAAGLFISGIGFTIQYFLDPSVAMKDLVASQVHGSNRDNPWQDSAAIFAFTFSLAASIYYLRLGKYMYSFVFLGVYGAMLVMYLSTVSRAPIGLSIAVNLITLFFAYRSARVKGYIAFVIASIIAFVFILIFSFQFDNLLSQGFSLLLEKTESSGFLNSRDIEMIAVFKNASNPVSFLVGEGWGGLLSNPIGGGTKWRFVHNSFGYYFFKTGIIGLIGYLFYLLWCLRVFRNFFSITANGNFLSILLISSIPPLAISLLLEASYKSISSGVLLTMLLAIRFSSTSDNMK